MEDRISDEEALDALKRSGYLLESRVRATIAAREDWRAFLNRPYQDETGTSREYDVEASYHVPMPVDRSLEITLAIECVNNAQPFVLFQGPDRTHFNAVTTAGMPLYLPGPFRPIQTALSLNVGHHYGEIPHATQFCSFAKKKDARNPQWFATHETSHFDSFRTLSQVVQATIEDHYETVRLLIKADVMWLMLVYPLIVLGGELLVASGDGDELSLTRSDHACFEYATHVKGKVRQLFVDVVTETHLDAFLARLESEHEPLGERVEELSTDIIAAARLYRAQFDAKPDWSIRGVLELPVNFD
jgi:hypothetical protein